MDAILEYLFDAGRYLLEAAFFNSSAAIIGSLVFLRACCILVDAETQVVKANRIIQETERRACSMAQSHPTIIH